MNYPSDIMTHITPFLQDQYINTAGINKGWLRAYGTLPKTTLPVDKDTTVDQFMDHLEMGCGREVPSCPPGVYMPPRSIVYAEKPCAVASSLGRTDLLQAGYESGLARKYTSTFDSAARNGHMETLKYLKFVECPWNVSTALSAVESGRIEVLEWVIENGCPCDGQVMLKAASVGNIEMVIFLHYNVHTVGEEDLREAVYNGHVGVLEWARRLDITYPSLFSSALYEGDLMVLDYFKETRYPWSSIQVDMYVSNFEIPPRTIEWLIKYGYLIE